MARLARCDKSDKESLSTTIKNPTFVRRINYSQHFTKDMAYYWFEPANKVARLKIQDGVEDFSRPLLCYSRAYWVSFLLLF